MVRRSVVVKAIQTMKPCGHRAYKHMIMTDAIEKAAALPEHRALHR